MTNPCYYVETIRGVYDENRGNDYNGVLAGSFQLLAKKSAE